MPEQQTPISEQLTQLTSQWRKEAGTLVWSPHADDTEIQLALMLKTCAEQVDTITGAIEHAMPWLPAHSPSWEVAFGPVDTVIEAHSAGQAATLSAAERDFEAETDRYAEPDPNPRVWVRQLKAGGTYGSWQQVYLDPAAIETAVARLRADEEGS